MRLFVTGGAGFIGSNFIRYWLENHSSDCILNFDILTYAGNLASLADVAEKYKNNYQFVKGNIADQSSVNKTIKDFRPDIIVNFAAESHNSYAILNPTVFFKTNLMGAQTLLEAARINKVPRFHHISTCEVYGDLPLDSAEKFTEKSPYRPRTPYNASKAASDHAVRAYFETFKLPATISNCSNNYGPYQFPEKIIPLFATNLLDKKPIPLYKNSQNKREWLHVLDHCKAIDFVINKGKIGETYNVGSGIEKSIEDIADIILKNLGAPSRMKTYIEDRPGHDRRYLLDSSKIAKELGWRPEISFETGIKQTIDWYKNNPEWWRDLKGRSPVIENNWGKNGEKQYS
ncbi:dTDP-glucose 4,6-dehydratase [Patescibacteria group bacterium]|nr:dTDP-glucose 4,6-dehydratase [Patescibacteria group bacterium]MBU4579758.1 dTDP-glucose 4,6-dehydratase [Patescibacteria group bacterium]